jgi:hypothetical protein
MLHVKGGGTICIFIITCEHVYGKVSIFNEDSIINLHMRKVE